MNRYRAVSRQTDEDANKTIFLIVLTKFTSEQIIWQGRSCLPLSSGSEDDQVQIIFRFYVRS